MRCNRMFHSVPMLQPRGVAMPGRIRIRLRAVLAVSLMFCDTHHRMLASMGELGRWVDASPLNWGELGVSALPTGTVTLLLADIEGSTRLWETQPEVMTAAVARLDEVLCDLISTHHGVRPVEQGEGDSFVIAFG